jgi:hypothetical protein
VAQNQYHESSEEQEVKLAVTPEQLQSAFSHCTDFAKIMLEKHGEFHPFGAFVNASGGVEAIGAWTGEEHPKGQEVHDFLIGALRVFLRDGRAIAIAVATDVNIPEGYAAAHPDGLRVTLEAEGYSQKIYVPYHLARRGLLNRKKSVNFSEAFLIDLNKSI